MPRSNRPSDRQSKTQLQAVESPERELWMMALRAAVRTTPGGDGPTYRNTLLRG